MRGTSGPGRGTGVAAGAPDLSTSAFSADRGENGGTIPGIEKRRLRLGLPKSPGHRPSTPHLRRVGLLLLASTLSGCDQIIEGNGVHLAFAIQTGAERLRASDRSEEVVVFERLIGSSGPYTVLAGAKTDADPHPYLTVTGSRGGGTTTHLRFITVPKPLRVDKGGGTTEVVLRKNGGNIEVVDLR